MDFIVILLALVFLITFYLFSSMQDMKKKQAEKAVETGDLDTAMSIFMKSLSKNPEDVESIWQLGNINEEKGNFLEAIGYYNKLISLGKESKLFTTFELYRRAGLLYKKVNREQDALENLLQAYNLIQTSKDVLENIALIIFGQKSFHRAIYYFEKGYTLIKNKLDFFRQYALCLLLVGREQEALPLLEELESKETRNTFTRFMLGYSYYKIGAHQKARELLEDVINNDKSGSNAEMILYALKILSMIYLHEKNYEIVRELIGQMKKMNDSIKNETYKDEITTAYIFFRIRQGYFDMAMEEIDKNIGIRPDQMDTMTDDQKQRLKENKSLIFELVSALDRYKKEKDKASYTGKQQSKMDVEYSMIENKALDAQKKLDQIIMDWEEKFIQSQPLWDFFAEKPSVKFDPTLIIEKYTEDSIKTLKKNKQDFSSKKTTLSSPFGDGIPTEEELFSNKNAGTVDYPCNHIKEMNFPTFLQTAKGLAENMGFQVINQNLKVDPVSYSEGQAVDMMCTEKFKKESRVLFCFRRWNEPIGYFPMSEIIAAVKTFKANRLVLISSSNLSDEARRSIDGMSSINFYLCEDVENYLRDVITGD